MVATISRVDLEGCAAASSDKTYSRNSLGLLSRRFRAGLLVGVVLEECRRSIFIGLPGCHAADEALQLIFVGYDLDVIHRKEDNGSYCAGSFVAVNEWVVLSDVKQIRRSHLKDVLVQILITKSGSGHRDSRLKQAHVTDAERATVALDLVFVNLKNIIETKEFDMVHLLGQLLQGAPVSAVCLVECFLELGGTRFIPNRSNNKYVPVRRNLDRSIVIYLEQIKHTTLDNQSHAVAVLCEFLDHSRTPLSCDSVHTVYHQSSIVSNGFSQTLECILQSLVRKMSVDFSRGDVSVAEGALDQQQVGRSGVEMRRERVPEAVRGDAFRDPGCIEPVFETLRDLPVAEPCASCCQ